MIGKVYSPGLAGRDGYWIIPPLKHINGVINGCVANFHASHFLGNPKMVPIEMSRYPLFRTPERLQRVLLAVVLVCADSLVAQKLG